jgi:hypothetical protein
VASSAYHSRGGGGRGDSSVRSSRSYKSSGSVATWSSKQSRKRMDKKDGSFLPLDADGYCLHHPEVQLAEVDRKGGWNVLLDFCPGTSENCISSFETVLPICSLTISFHFCFLFLKNAPRKLSSLEVLSLDHENRGITIQVDRLSHPDRLDLLKVLKALVPLLTRCHT